MSSSYDVTVRLTTIGTSDLAGGMKAAQGAMQSVATEANNVDAALRRVSATVKGVNDDGTKYSVTMKQVADSTKMAGDSMGAFSGAMGVVGAAFAEATAAFAAGIVLIKKGYDDLVKPGLEFNSFLEMNRLALSAMQLTFGQYVDAEGKAVDQTRQWSDATAQATINQELLIKQSLSSAVSVKDLANVFQMMYGAMIAGGAKSQQEMVTFAGVTADMAAVMGTSYDRAARQMTLALLGVTRTTGQLGAMLRSMGIDNATLKSWRDQGIIVEELTTKLHAFVEMQPLLQTTWIGITTNMQTAWQQLTGVLSKDVFQQIKVEWNDLLHSVMDFDTGKVTDNVNKALQSMGAGIAGAFNLAVDTVKLSLDAIGTALSDHGATWLDVFKAVGSSFVFVANGFADMTLTMISFLKHPIDSLFDSITSLFAGMMEYLLRGLANFAEEIGRVAGNVATLTKGGIGAGIAAQAEKDAASLRTLADGWKDVKTVGGASIDELRRGLKQLDDDALYAYTQIQRVGKSALDLGGDPSSPMFQALYGDQSMGTDKYKKNPKTTDTSKLDALEEAYLTKTQEMWAKADAYTEQGLAQKLALIDVETLKEIDAAEKSADAMIKAGMGVVKARQEEDDRIAAIEDAGEKRRYDAYLADLAKAKAKDDAAQRQTEAFDAWQTNEAAKLNDELSAITLNYYDKQQALIDRQTAAEQKALDTKLAQQKLKDPDASTDWYTADVNALDTLSAARTAFNNRERDSIIGLRKQWEEDGKLIVMTSDSVTGGLAAGWLAVMGTMKTTTESVRDFVVGVWNDLGTAFDTGFYDVLTGKFSDLGNVLKNLWDSILKDFSKMLTQMLERWILTGDAMSSDSKGGVGGGAPSLVGSLVGAGGNTAYTGEGGGVGGGQWGVGLGGGQQWGVGAGGQGTGGGGGLVGGLAAAGALYYAGSTIGNAMGSNRQPYTIAGQQYQGDFGGNAKFGDFLGPAMAVAAVGVIGAASIAAALAATGIISAAGTAAAAAVIPVVGWIAAAVILIVGAILAIVNGPKEAKVPLPTSMMGDGSAVGQAMLQNYGQTYGTLSDINRAGGGSSSDFAAYMNANMAGTKSWQPYLHAGSGDDLTKDAKQFFDVVLPRINIQQAFGQQWTGGYHSGTDAGYAGIGGAPTMVAGSYDENAAIPQMLKGLGLLPAAIHGIAMQIDLRDPADFLVWLGRVVNVVAGFKTTVTNLNKSWVDIQADQQKADWHGGYNPLSDASKNVVALAGEIGNYVGDEQLTKMEELQKASDAYYASAAAALKVLTDMMNTVTGQVDAFHNTVAQIGKSGEWLASDRTNRLGLTGPAGGQYGPELANDASTTAVQATWDAFMKDANDQLNYLIGIQNELNSGLATMKGLAKDFDNIANTASRDALDINTIFSDWKGLNDLITATSLLDPMSAKFLTNTQLIAQGTQSMYQELLGFLQAVNSAKDSLATGVAGDVWQNTYMITGNTRNAGGTNGAPGPGPGGTGNNDWGQIGMIKDKIDEDLGLIGHATDPTTVTRLSGEIRGLLHTYQGFFKQGDPNYNAAYEWSNKVLGELNTVGSAALGSMGIKGEQLANYLGTGGAGMQSAQDLFITALSVTTVKIGELNDAVDAFGGKVKDKLSGWADDISTDMKKAGDALVLAMNTFTTALGGNAPGAGAPGGTGNPKSPLVPLADLSSAATDAVGNESTGLIAFTKALNTATHALNGGA